MKSVRHIMFMGFFALVFSSCSLFNKSKQGCGDNGGRNVGAEKIIDGSGPKKQTKFKA
jgi:hypothetical protein